MIDAENIVGRNSKRLSNAKKLVDSGKTYSVDEAVQIIKKMPPPKFNETIELSISLGINPKQADQLVRGTVVLPHGTGRVQRIAVIAKGEKIKEAEQSGADVAGGIELIDKIQKGWMEFDVLVATPDVMKDVGKLGKMLGTKGLMPNPKSGTVTFDIKDAVERIKAGQVEYRNDSSGIVHAGVGKMSFEQSKLCSNIRTFIQAIVKARPSSVKGQYIKSITLSSTMGPGISLEIPQS